MNEIRNQEQFEAPGLEIGDYVLVQFLQKKGKSKHFVGKIFSRNSSYRDFQIQFFKRIGGSNKFVCESEELFDVEEADIIIKIHKPIVLKG
jgi:hypothetical protein